MCTKLIIDANSMGLVTGSGEKDARLVGWLESGGGVLCMAGGGKSAEELQRNREFFEIAEGWLQSGRAFYVEAKQIEAARDQLEQNAASLGLVSDDRHVLEVALAGRASVLVSRDADLCADFKLVMKSQKISAKLYPQENPESLRRDPEGHRRRLETQRRDFVERHKCRRRQR